jgi:hypothetical protein
MSCEEHTWMATAAARMWETSNLECKISIDDEILPKEIEKTTVHFQYYQAVFSISKFATKKPTKPHKTQPSSSPQPNSVPLLRVWKSIPGRIRGRRGQGRRGASLPKRRKRRRLEKLQWRDRPWLRWCTCLFQEFEQQVICTNYQLAITQRRSGAQAIQH